MTSLPLPFPFNVDERVGKGGEVVNERKGGWGSSVGPGMGCFNEIEDASGTVGEEGVDVEGGEVGETGICEGRPSYLARTFSPSSFCTVALA